MSNVYNRYGQRISVLYYRPLQQKFSIFIQIDLVPNDKIYVPRYFLKNIFNISTIFTLRGSPNLVVMGGDSCYEGSNPVFWMDIFSHIFVVKIVMKFV